MFSIIYSYRNRDVDRIKRSIDSLCSQTFKDFEIIFINSGSSEKFSSDISKLINGYKNCRYIYTETRGYPWNKSNALNIGIKSAKYDYILINDIDIIFPKDLLEKIKNRVNEKNVVFTRYYFCDQKFNDWENVSTDNKNFYRANEDACGVLCVSKKHFLEMNGYDEYFYFWGIEDRDVRNRFQLLGLKEVWDDDIYQFHQWHQVKTFSTDRYMPVGFWPKIQEYYFKNLKKLKRNDSNFGKLLKSDERKIFEYIDLSKNEIIKKNNVFIKEYKVYYPETGGEFIEDFYNLKKGNVFAVPNMFYPKESNMINFIINKSNGLLKRLKVKSGIDYYSNFLRGSVFNFIHDNKDLIEDYYLDFPDRTLNGCTLILKK
jgi:glycosyltransferase involved in cell wall biosynthesis